MFATHLFRSILLTIFLAFLLSGCGGAPRTLPADFKSERDIKPIESAPPEVVRAFEAGINREYLLGGGDIVEILAPVYPEIAGEQTVSPEGMMTIYPAGNIQVSGLTRTEAELRIKETLTKYFSPLALTLRIKTFENNQVLVLGKVVFPGVVKFKSRPNLLEALAKAGAFPSNGLERRFSRCDIIRGKDQILRVSIDDLLKSGAGGRNIDLANNDIVYIPENEENNVYVMGEVNKPGGYEIRTSMTLLNAVMLASGPTENARVSEIMLVRDRGAEAEPLKINLDRMVDSSDFAGNLLLKRNDIVYVPRRGIATVNYYLRMINPFTQLIFFGTTLAK